MAQHKILTWTARVTGLLVTIFFLSFFIGEGMQDIINGNGKGLIRFIPYTLPVFAGYVLAWFRPLWGGWLLIAGGILLAGYFIYHGDYRIALIYGLPSFLVGACFLASINRELI